MSILHEYISQFTYYLAMMAEVTCLPSQPTDLAVWTDFLVAVRCGSLLTVALSP